MTEEIKAYNDNLELNDREICSLLANLIDNNLENATCKIWHAHPVWFIDGNPIVGYAKRKDNVQLLFWSGQSFDEPGLKTEGSFKASQVRYTNVDEVNTEDLKRWLKKAEKIQWNYKDIVKNKGKLDRLK